VFGRAFELAERRISIWLPVWAERCIKLAKRFDRRVKVVRRRLALAEHGAVSLGPALPPQPRDAPGVRCPARYDPSVTQYRPVTDPLPTRCRSVTDPSSTRHRPVDPSPTRHRPVTDPSPHPSCSFSIGNITMQTRVCHEGHLIGKE